LRKQRRTADAGRADVAGAFRTDEQSAVSLDVQAALRTLGGEQLSCVLLTAYAGYSSQEAAALLGISPEAVRQRVSRAMRALRPLLRGPE